MVINSPSVLVSGFGVGFGLVHTALVVFSGYFGMFQYVSGSAVNGHDNANWERASPGARPRATEDGDELGAGDGPGRGHAAGDAGLAEGGRGHSAVPSR